MIDAHCHVDAYPDPLQTAMYIEQRRTVTIAVTNSPTAFQQAYSHVRGFRFLRLAVGLHPLLGNLHPRERSHFRACLSQTSYVGEVGLDFSYQGLSSKTEQLKSFRFVLESVRKEPKFMSIHSRQAETVTLDLLEEFQGQNAVFHWFGGSLSHLERLLRLGCACSVNAAMLRSRKGRAIVENLPTNRVVTETDGPFAKIDGRAANPGEVGVVVQFLADLWRVSVPEVNALLWTNLLSLVPGSKLEAITSLVSNIKNQDG